MVVEHHTHTEREGGGEGKGVGKGRRGGGKGKQICVVWCVVVLGDDRNILCNYCQAQLMR